MILKQILLTFTLSITTLFAEIPEIVSYAFEKFDQDTVFSYSYFSNTQTKSENFIEKYDPGKKVGDQWELISVNGKTPTKDRLKEYYKVKDNVNNEHSVNLNTDNMNSFVLFNETAEFLTYSFKLNESKKNKMAKHLKCKLDINKNNKCISKIKMYIEKPFSPMLSVKINNFKMEMIFQQMTDTGANLIKNIKTIVKGKAFLIKEIDENTIIEYHDYQLVQ